MLRCCALIGMLSRFLTPCVVRIRSCAALRLYADAGNRMSALVPRRARSARATPRANPYHRPCPFCNLARTCSACIDSAGCTECTRTALCGSCRNLYSRLRRASGFSSSNGLAGCTSLAAATAVAPADAPVPTVDAVDLPRSRGGLAAYYRLVASTTDAASCSGGRWSLMSRARLSCGSSSLIQRINTRRRRGCGGTRCARLPSTATRTPRHSTPSSRVPPVLDLSIGAIIFCK